MSVYDFDEQHEQGQQGEQFLDAFFAARGHYIQPATRGQQRHGIDRVFLWDGKMAKIEYKTDYLAHDTGHVFIETISIDTDDKAGWAYTSHADLLVYYIPGRNVIYIIPLERLRKQLPRWCETYPTRPAQNKQYATHGVLVPIGEFEQYTTQTLSPDPAAR